MNWRLLAGKYIQLKKIKSWYIFQWNQNWDFRWWICTAEEKNHDLNILRKSILNLVLSSFTLVRNLNCQKFIIYEIEIFVTYTRPAPSSSLHEIKLHQSLQVLPHLSQNSFWLDTAQKASTQSQSSNPSAWKKKCKIKYVWRVLCSFLEAEVP